MPWRRFLIWNFLGATAWVTVICSAGYLFGRHLGRLQRAIGRIDAIVAVAVLIGAAFWWWRNRRRNGQASAE
jgi:membrane protein DedA with SNARE-associated domain